MRVSVVQMDVQTGQFRANLEQAYKGIQIAAARGSKVVLLPEMWTTGFAYSELLALSRSVFGPTMEFLTDCAQESKVWLLGSLPEVEGSTVFNTFFYVRPNGEIAGSYRKVHLFAPMYETDHFGYGKKVTVVDTEWSRIGGMVCFDLRFPELARRMTIEGAKVLFVPAQFPNPRKEHWDVLLKARAIENQVFMVACNRVGATDDLSFFGASTIVDPWGNTLDALEDKPGVITADLDLELVDRVRRGLAVLPARRPDVYGDCLPQ